MRTFTPLCTIAARVSAEVTIESGSMRKNCGFILVQCSQRKLLFWCWYFEFDSKWGWNTMSALLGCHHYSVILELPMEPKKIRRAIFSSLVDCRVKYRCLFRPKALLLS